MTAASWETVFVLYIRNPSYFVVQREDDIPKIEQMSVEIDLKVGNRPLSSCKEKQFQPGQLLVVQNCPDKMHQVLRMINLDLSAIESHSLHENDRQRLLSASKFKIYVGGLNFY